jgi:hypothetical protein
MKDRNTEAYDDVGGVYTLEDVLVVSETPYSTRVRLFLRTESGDNFFVYQDEVLAGSIRKLGDFGRLIVPLAVAFEHGFHSNFELE